MYTRRNILIGVVIIILLGLAAIWLFWPSKITRNGYVAKAKTEISAQVKSGKLYDAGYEVGYEAGLIACQGNTQAMKDSMVLIAYKLRLCMGLEKMPVTPAGTITTTGGTKSNGKTYAKTPINKAAQPVVKPATAFTPPAAADKTNLNPPPVRTGGNIEGGLLSIDNYFPAYLGDFCTTVQNAYLVYAISDSYWQKCTQKTVSAPMIEGQAMILDSSIGYWVLISGTILTPETIVNGTYRWSVYIGKFQGSGFSYDMYLPHESVKPIMRSVRGREDGEVTSDEIGRMGQQDENIGRGLIAPNQTSVVGSDGNIYFGWAFNTPVNYTVKTN